MEKEVYNVLVFPCGSEIGLEIFRALEHARQFKLVGASSVSDHGRFVFTDYEEGLPMAQEDSFEPAIVELVKRRQIDLLFPTMDGVIERFALMEERLPCILVGHPLQTAVILSSKKKTYEKLLGLVPLPLLYDSLAKVDTFPVFMKPDKGYGSRGAKKICNKKEGELHQAQVPGCLLMEYLPGKEFTIDCFSDANGSLLFSKARTRQRIMNGISVHTMNTKEEWIQRTTYQLAEKINAVFSFRGSWFFQCKEDKDGALKIMEVAARLAGSSSIHRVLGVNFAILNIWVALQRPVKILLNKFEIEADRALDIKYKASINYDHVWVDLDDTLLLKGRVNARLVGFLFQQVNLGKKLILITRHKENLYQTLENYRLSGLFDEIVHLKKDELKSTFITSGNCIFIDDSFSERWDVYQSTGVPVFSTDAVECLW